MLQKRLTTTETVKAGPSPVTEKSVPVETDKAKPEQKNNKK